MGERCARLHWNDDYRTGSPALDDQHLTLILLYNDVMRALERRASAHMVAETIDTLIGFLRTHFMWEERHLAARGLGRPPGHAVRNARFEAVAQAFYQYLGLYDAGESFAAFAREWIVEHIKAERPVPACAPGERWR